METPEGQPPVQDEAGMTAPVETVSTPSTGHAPAQSMLAALVRNVRGGIRLAFLQRAGSAEFIASPEAYSFLVVLNLLVLFFLGVASAGIHGYFDYYELPRAFLFVPLTLFFGLIAARLAGQPRPLLLLPVALASAGTFITVACGMLALLVQHQFVSWTMPYWTFMRYATSAWWLAVIMVTTSRFLPMPHGRAVLAALAGAVLLVLPGWWYPQSYLWAPVYDAAAQEGSEARFAGPSDEKAFYAQQEMLQRTLAKVQPERPGIPDIYLLTAGLYGREDVFMKEVKSIEELFRKRFDTEGRSVVLVNNPKAVYEYPVASLTSLSASLRHLGSRMNAAEDVLVLYVSSHGSETHQLSVDFWPLRLQPIDPALLKKALDASGIKWKVIVISACYSGGFIDPLKDEHSMIITASSATRQSFGCGNASDSTYLAKALFDEELRKTYSFETAFGNARRTIAVREKAQEFKPSEPQIFVGAAIRDKLKQIEERLTALNPPPQE